IWNWTRAAPGAGCAGAQHVARIETPGLAFGGPEDRLSEMRGRRSGCRRCGPGFRRKACHRPVGGNKRSAFFFRLPLRAKSAMAEILVSDFCECRPPLLVGGLFVGPIPVCGSTGGGASGESIVLVVVFCLFFPLFPPVLDFFEFPTRDQ